jgi:16S rRNA processing protein RimM
LKILEVGRVAKPHGVRGELKVQLHWEHSSVLLHVDSVVLCSGQHPARSYGVERARRSTRFVLLKLRGVDDRAGADLLRGAAVAVARAQLPALGEGEFYLGDLVGARVLGPGGLVGDVVEVLPYPSVDVAVVRTPEGKLVEQPLTEPWLERVDATQGCIHLSSTDGLIE